MNQVSSSEEGGQFNTLKFHILTKFHHAGYAAKKFEHLEVAWWNVFVRLS